MHCCNFKACTKKYSPNHPNHKHENNRHFSYWPNLVLFANFWLESQCDKYTFPLCCSSKESMHYPNPFCTFQPLHFPLMCTIKTNRCTSQNLFGFCTDAQQTHTHTHTHTYQPNTTIAFPYLQETHTHIHTHTHKHPAHTWIPTHTYSHRASAVHMSSSKCTIMNIYEYCLHALHICHPPPPPVDGLFSNGNIIIQGDFPCQYWNEI